MKARLILWGAATLALAGCDRKTEAPPVPDPVASLNRADPVSIIRPDIEVEREEPPLGDLKIPVPFDEGGGSELSDKALAVLRIIIDSPQMAAGGPIVLRGHTDSVGRDDANLRISQERAEAVHDRLVEEGIDEDRIRIVSLGEMRPVAPNATLEGEPHEEGRAANRRVDVLIEVPGEELEVSEDVQ